MLAKHIYNLLGALIGALAGAALTGLLGALFGIVAGWFLPIGLHYLSAQQRLARAIQSTLQEHGTLQVRDIMRLHGLAVPSDCFTYSEAHSFVCELNRYRKALTALESDGSIIHAHSASVKHGYVDPPNEWVNEWSGRAYHR
jgi:hypothetical protein